MLQTKSISIADTDEIIDINSSAAVKAIVWQCSLLKLLHEFQTLTISQANGFFSTRYHVKYE
jgi:hypothetical protein